MNAKSLWVFFAAIFLAVVDPALGQTDKPSSSTALDSPQNEGTEDEEAPPSPKSMKISEPKFNLGVFRTTDQKPRLQLELNSAILTDSALTAPTTDARTTSDTLFFNGATLRASPKLGSHTRLAADVGGGIARYDGDPGYNLLNASLGIQQELTDNLSGDLGWTFRQIYGLGSFNNLTDHGARLGIKRSDRLFTDAFLNSGYEIQAYFSDPADRSRVVQFFRLGLGYGFTPKLHGLLSYRLIHDEFTHNDLDDTRHETGVRVNYQIWSNVVVGASVSYLAGDAVSLLTRNPAEFNQPRDLNHVTFGVELGINIPLLD